LVTYWLVKDWRLKTKKNWFNSNFGFNFLYHHNTVNWYRDWISCHFMHCLWSMDFLSYHVKWKSQHHICTTPFRTITMVHLRKTTCRSESKSCVKGCQDKRAMKKLLVYTFNFKFCSLEKKNSIKTNW
jgi:hypothetical protein